MPEEKEPVLIKRKKDKHGKTWIEITEYINRNDKQAEKNMSTFKVEDIVNISIITFFPHVDGDKETREARVSLRHISGSHVIPIDRTKLLNSRSGWIDLSMRYSCEISDLLLGMPKKT